MEFFLGLAWCLSGYMAWKIGEILDQKKNSDWQDQVCGLIFGPILLIPLAMEYFKRRKRAKYTAKEMLSRRKDIYDLWDWLWDS